MTRPLPPEARLRAPGAGRKPRGDAPATERVTVRLTPAVLARVEDAAKASGVPLAAWAAGVLEGAATPGKGGG